MDTHHLPLLKIMAKDREDLHIIAAHVQDALLPLHGLHFDHGEGTFSALCNRFCWEHDGHFFEDKPLYHRVHSGLCFRSVQSIHFKGLEDTIALHPLNLLSIQANEHPPEAKPGYAHVHLLFSGESEIRLTVNTITCHLGDLHHPWPTRVKPGHTV
ncbi:MAG: DUF2948 family protein [Alphaproteobacteria bacterium]|nr:DUF2948 family protein [Alphaproteobacteria bacterium]